MVLLARMFYMLLSGGPAMTAAGSGPVCVSPWAAWFPAQALMVNRGALITRQCSYVT